VNSRVNSCIGIHHVLRTRRAPADIGATTAEKLEGTLHSHGGRNWVHKKIPGCAVELNTQNCAWFGIQISLVTAMSFRGAVPPPEPAPGPRWGTSVPQTPVPPPPNPGYATDGTSRVVDSDPFTFPPPSLPCLPLFHSFPFLLCFSSPLSLNLASWSGEAP